MNLFKIFIPQDKAQEITELESWTVKWESCSCLRWGESKVYNKCFIKVDEAREFKRQLQESAAFIKTPINTSIEKN